jgi:hypothetical protein
MKTEKQRNDFVVSLAGENIDLTVVNIEEMTNYSRERKRLANVVTEKQTYGELEKTNYALIMNYKNPSPRVINTKGKPYVHVYNILQQKYKGGLLIAEADTMSEPISECLCSSAPWEANDVDIMVCRSFASVTAEELCRATLIRISADPDFDPMVLARMGDSLQEGVAAIMIAQLFVNDNYDNVNKYIESVSNECSAAGLTDFINYYDLRKQLAYFLYYDTGTKKLIGIDRDTLIKFMKSLPSAMIPVKPEEIDIFAEMITL